MPVEEITVKTILNAVKQPDDWFGLKYNMNLYRGCQHQCIYCDSRSTCYQIENFANIFVKINAIELLEETLPRKRFIGTVGTGSMNDPYMPVERRYNLTGRALACLAHHGFPVHIITKSDLVVRDIDILQQISRIYAAVSFTVTTADDDLARKLEPGAPLPSARFKAMRALTDRGILTGVTLMPVLPFIEDTMENIMGIVRLAHQNGARYILPSMGVTLRDGSRQYYYASLDRSFPGIRQCYERRFGFAYMCSSPHANSLHNALKEECDRLGIDTRMPVFEPRRASSIQQLNLF